MNASQREPQKAAPRVPIEFTALLAALQLSSPDLTPLYQLTGEQWTSLLDFACRAHLTLSLAQLPCEGFPPWVVEQLRSNVADNSLRFERVKATYRKAAQALDQAGVEHIVLKGFTQAPEYVASPQLRAQSDIDFFCPPESIETARDALQKLGYRAAGEAISYVNADHEEMLVRLDGWQWKGNHFDPEMPLSLELHYCLWNERVSRISIPEVGHFWERRITREVEEFSFHCLSPVDHLAHLSLHILRNIFLADWIIHHVRELAFFLHAHAGDDGFWRQWNETHSAELRSLQAISFYYAHAWFGCRLHSQAAAEIDSLPAIRKSWLRTFSGSTLESMFHQNKDFLWLHLSLLSSMGDQWGIARRTLLPPRVKSIRSEAIDVRNKRMLPVSARPRWRRYLAYLITRSREHGGASLRTLLRGLRWRLSVSLFKRDSAF